jgi:hypothetical protein
MLDLPPAIAEVRRFIAAMDPRLGALADVAPGSAGVRLEGTGRGPGDPGAGRQGRGIASPTQALRLLVVEALFGTEPQGCLSPPLRGLSEGPVVSLSPGDAAAAGVAQGETAELTCGAVRVPVRIRVHAGVARGVAVAPRAFGSPLGSLPPGWSAQACSIAPGGRP